MTDRGDGEVRIDPAAAIAAAAALADAAEVVARAGEDVLDGMAAVTAALRCDVAARSLHGDLEHSLDGLVDALSALSAGLAADGAALRDAATSANRADTGLGSQCHPPAGPGQGRLPAMWNTAVQGSVSAGINSIYSAVDIWGPGRLGAVDPSGIASELLLTTIFGKGSGGDLGGTYTSRPVAAIAAPPATGPTGRGRHVVRLLLAATGDLERIHTDEFTVVDHGGNRYSVVLPGVTDLAVPNADLHLFHRSVRDLNRFAVPSAASTRIADNEYARMVAEGLQRHGVPAGADLLLVGHSFGADTALDLAADRRFNGDRYRVTHVVAAAYQSEPQLAQVQPDTKVLVLQNRHDLVVAAESLHDRLTFDEPAPSRGGRAVQRQFDGGLGLDLGHHQDRYTDFVGRSDDPAMLAFFRSVASAGYGRGGEMTSIDVSVPR